jgi:hypothetical protein
MGWLFGRKKPKVPLPTGHPVDENALQFPALPSGDKVIEPESVKKAVGVGKPVAPQVEEKSLSFPEERPAPPPLKESPGPMRSDPSQSMSAQPQPAMVPHLNGPLFVKVGVYQRILGEVEDLKERVADLAEANRKLEDSEYNEEHHFEKLKRTIKVMHDRLLQVDKTIYKSQGD